MLGVQDQAAVEQLGLVIRIFAVRAHQMQDILRSRALGVGHMQEHGIPVEIPALGLIGVRDDDRELGHQADALAHDVFHRGLIRVGVVGIERQRRAGELVHNIPAGRAHNHILGEVVRQGALQADRVLELLELAAVRQLAAHEQIAHLLKPEAVFLLQAVDQVVDVIAAVGQAAFDRLALAFVEYVAVYVAQIARADQHAGAVRIAQAALDAEPVEQLGRDLAVRPEAVAQLAQQFLAYKIRLNRHPPFSFLMPLYFRMNIFYRNPAYMSISAAWQTAQKPIFARFFTYLFCMDASLFY